MKVSLIGQIAEVDREIAMRQRVYPEQMRKGKMRQAEADLLMQRIQAVRESLVFLKEHESFIRAMIVAKIADPLMEEAMKIAEEQKDKGGRYVRVPGHGRVYVPLKRAR